MDSGAAFWTVARTAPSKERFVADRLEEAGIEIYLPRVKERITICAGHSVTVARPLFVAYLFAKVVDGQWGVIRRTPSVTRVLLAGDRPARVGEHVIAGLRSRQRNGFVVLPKRPKFKPGDQVRVTRGAFAGVDALYEGQAPRDRVKVLLQLLGVPRVAELAEADIEPA
jgi:transcriptional antiterminator RfaH